jgi:cytochrome d ubiquinol oxidase subunit I
MLDALLIARLQFAFTISFHILFPAFSIGLASWLVTLELLWLKTGKPAFQSLYRFWLKIFAVSFGLGVVSGIVMSFEFGTNWSAFSARAGNIVGPLLGYEVMTAFFLEATFLGIMLFGQNRVRPAIHFFATCMVALGTLISAFWILAASSWMHTPSGYVVRDGVFEPDSWLRVIFNPSFPYRFVHMTLAAYLATCFVIAGVAARYLRRGLYPQRAKLMLELAIGFASVVVPLQIVAGDMHGLNTLEHQPAKIAAVEAHWETRAGAPLVLFAWPDGAAERNRFAIEVPKLGSLILRHDVDATITGLKDFPRADRPPVVAPFFAFRAMVGIGLLMLTVAWSGLVQLLRGKLIGTRWLLRVLPWMMPSGFVAVLSGWVVTEVGRQPYVVYGLMRTSEAVSAVPAGNVATTLALFVVVYGVVFGAGIHYIAKLVRAGPGEIEMEPHGTAARPLGVPGETAEDAR